MTPTWPAMSMAAIRRKSDAVPRRRSDHDHAGADPDPFVEIDHVLVAHADAARRHRRADRPGLVRSVNAVERGAELHSERAERVFRAARDEGRKVRAPPQ